MKPIRTYAVTVQGFDPGLYSARSPGKALAKCWRDYGILEDLSFRDFMKKARVRRQPDPPGIGERIMVCGEEVTRVIGGHPQYVAFMRDTSDEIIFSHPLDVSPVAAETSATA